MKKGFLACVVAGLLALGCLAGCGKSGGGDDGGDPIIPDAPITEKVKIEFWGWGDPAEQSNYQTLVNQFMAEPGNENITVNYVGNTATNHMNKLDNTNKKNLPDLFMLSDYDFYGWAADGMLKDITASVSEEELSAIWTQAVEEYYYNPKTKALGKGEGAKLYGLPKDLGPFTLVYNEDLLKKQAAANGVTNEEIATLLNPKQAMTWAQFRDLLKRLQKGLGDNQYAISHYELEAAIYSNDAAFFTDDAATSLITDKKFTDALQFIADLDLVDHVMTPASGSDVDGFSRFSGGQCIFSFMGPWDCAQFWSFESVNFKTNILPVPYNGENPDAKSTTWVGSMAYCIGANTKSDKAAAALRLAKYLSMNETAQRKFYELGQQVPNIVSMAKDEYVNDTRGLLQWKEGDKKTGAKDPVDRSVWLDTIDGFSETDKIGGKVRSRYYTYSSGWLTSFQDYLTQQGFWTGAKTAAEVCGEYNKTFQDALDQMRRESGIR